jgi:hypothetical protein
MNDEMLMVLERIASALEKQNELMEAQELRQRKLDKATYESLKSGKSDQPRIITVKTDK